MKILALLSLIFTKQNAVILILCRNEELDGINKTIQNFEQRFNSKYNYPYVFLNDKQFTEEFKEKLSQTTKNRATFGLVEPEMWNMPSDIDEEKMKKEGEKMVRAGVPYADKLSYHNMCRFFSRSFYKHPLVSNYEYYWRIEPNVSFRCDIDFDPFDFMKNKKKKYGFVITIHEFMNSIPNLMKFTAKFLLDFHDQITPKNHLTFMYDNGRYNGCHFWSNFEIASFDFFRSKIYNEYVDALEKAGGFYYERWGDAPVHSIAASMFLDKSEVHFFEEIGYTHDAFTHCPKNGKNCDCTQKDSIDFTQFSCLQAYLNDNK